MTATKKSTSSTKNQVAKELQQVLSVTHSLYLVTHNYHWNVEGQHFASLHKLFEDQYNDLFNAMDEIAERIRALGVYAKSFEDNNILKEAQKYPRPQAKSADGNASTMIKNLITFNEKAIDACQKAKKQAADHCDDETEDLLIGRVTTHQKAVWMLKSLLA